MNKNVLKGLKIAGNVVFYTIICILLLFSIANIRKKDKASYANLFGYGFLTVESPSMQGDGEDNFDIGDLIVVRKATKKRIANLKVGDIITFYDPSLEEEEEKLGEEFASYLNTHRIVYINTQGSETIFYTQGDYNIKEFGWKYVAPIYSEDGRTLLNADEFAQNALHAHTWEEVPASMVLGIYSGHSTGWGKFMTFVNDNFFLCVVLPVILLFLAELVIVIMNIINMKNEKAKEELALNADAQKEELRKQILAEMDEQSKEELKRQILEELKKEQEENKEE